jgi:hypothetical protein
MTERAAHLVDRVIPPSLARGPPVRPPGAVGIITRRTLVLAGSGVMRPA